MKYLCGFILLLALLSGCNQQSSQEESETLQIAVIPKGNTHIFWKSVHAGAAKAAQELGVNIIWQGPQKEDDRQMQIQVVQNFISRKVDAIVLAPLDDRSLAPPVKSAVNRDIPVVIIDSDLKSDAYQSFVATNNEMGGELCAEQMAKTLNGKGKVLVLRYMEGSASTNRREEGFLNAIKKYPDIEIISANQYAGATMEKSFQVSQNLLNRFPQTEGVFCSNETTTAGMLRAMQTAGKTSRIKLIGFDANDILLEALRKGQIQGLAVQDPFQMGYLGVQTAYKAIHQEPFEKRVDTDVVMVTTDNMEETEMQAFMKPDIAKWLNE